MTRRVALNNGLTALIAISFCLVLVGCSSGGAGCDPCGAPDPCEPCAPAPCDPCATTGADRPAGVPEWCRSSL